MPEKTEIEFNKYKERGPHHINESRRSVFHFNAHQQARFDLMLGYLGDIEGKTVLDLGCGDGALTRFICQKKAKVIGVDNQELGLKFAREFLKSQGLEAKLILASVYETALPADSVDFIVASEVIEHVAEPDKLLKEARRILKPGGLIILSTPYRLTEKPMDSNHYKEFYPGEIKELVGAYFMEVEIKETHPAFWVCIYDHWLNIPICRDIHKCRSILKYLINFSALYLKRNPFLKDATNRRKREFFTQIFVKAKK